MMGIFDYYFDFQLSWLNAAVDHPARCMPKTMKYLNKNFVGEEHDTRQTQILRGLEKGREKMLKHTKRCLMQPPLILLVLTNRSRAPSFLRAVLCVLHNHFDQVPDQITMIHDAGDSWGKYMYTDLKGQPEDENIWHNLLTKDKQTVNNLIYFWQQFELNFRVLTGDLQKTSKASGSNGQSLGHFQITYPVFFECLYSKFGTMMSNSRLCEQVHGMMRHSLNPGIGMDQADHHCQYSTNTGYKMCEAR